MQVRLIDLACPAVIIMALCAGAGAMVRGHYDGRDAAIAEQRIQGDRKTERDAARDQLAAIKAELKELRDRTNAESKRRFQHDLAVTAHSQRVRSDLEALLADARSHADRCTADAARLGEIAASALDALDDADASITKAASEARGLESRNVALEGKIREWEAAFPEQIRVTGQRKP
jgi:chromosome segregation ATPase